MAGVAPAVVGGVQPPALRDDLPRHIQATADAAVDVAVVGFLQLVPLPAGGEAQRIQRHVADLQGGETVALVRRWLVDQVAVLLHLAGIVVGALQGVLHRPVPARVVEAHAKQAFARAVIEVEAEPLGVLVVLAPTDVVETGVQRGQAEQAPGQRLAVHRRVVVEVEHAALGDLVGHLVLVVEVVGLACQLGVHLQVAQVALPVEAIHAQVAGQREVAQGEEVQAHLAPLQGQVPLVERA